MPMLDVPTLTPIVSSWRLGGGDDSCPPTMFASSTPVNSENGFGCMLLDECTRDTNAACEWFRGALGVCVVCSAVPRRRGTPSHSYAQRPLFVLRAHGVPLVSV